MCGETTWRYLKKKNLFNFTFKLERQCITQQNLRLFISVSVHMAVIMLEKTRHPYTLYVVCNKPSKQHFLLFSYHGNKYTAVSQSVMGASMFFHIIYTHAYTHAHIEVKYYLFWFADVFKKKM